MITTAFILLPYILSLLITIWVGIYAWQRRAIPAARLFVGIVAFEAIWTASYILQLAAPGLPAKLFWNNVQFLGAVGAPLAYLGFALEYDRPGNLWRFSWKPFIPAAVLLLAFIWTDYLHGYFRGQPHLAPGSISPILVFTPAAGFAIYTIYAYGLIVLTTIILVSRFLVATRLYQSQIGIVLTAILIPWAASVITVLNPEPVALHEITPLTFGVCNLILAWALFRYRLFEIMPVARDFLVENMPEGVVVLDRHLRIADLNPVAQKTLGADKTQALGRDITAYLHLEPAWYRDMECGAAPKIELVIEMEGAPRFYEVQATRLCHPRDGSPIFLVFLRDIRERKKIEAKLQVLAITDPLTNTYNRRHLFFLIQREIERAGQLSRPLSILLFDIDHFKGVNDTYGHQVGDRVLEEMARRCQIDLRSADILGRYGGEEFMVALPETDTETARNIAERLRREVEGITFNGNHPEVRITISIGIATLGREEDQGLDQLVERADEALYRAKAAGRNTVCC